MFVQFLAILLYFTGYFNIYPKENPIKPNYACRKQHDYISIINNELSEKKSKQFLFGKNIL